MKNVAVIGAGAWGLALADLLAGRENTVKVWDRSAETIDQLSATRTINRPAGLVLDPRVQYEPDLSKAVIGAHFVLCVVPSYAVRDVCQLLRKTQTGIKETIFVSCSKGIESGTLMLPSQVFDEILKPVTGWEFAVIGGPSHAEEVSRQVPTVVVSAATDLGIARKVADLFHCLNFRVYTQVDQVGVQLGGAFKNVIAIAAGACDGMGFGDNTKAALVTRGVAEMARAAQALGGCSATMSGLGGMGDLIVTAMSQHSRNRRFGELIAQGNTPRQAIDKIGAAVEGYITAQSAYLLTKQNQVDMPIINAVYKVLYEQMSVGDSLHYLLERSSQSENEPPQ